MSTKGKKIFMIPQMSISRLTLALSLLTVLISLTSIPAPAQTPPSDLDYSADKWHDAASPYLWLAGMNGSVAYGGHSVQVNQSFTDIFSNLKFGVMGLNDVNRGPLSLLTDVMYVRLGNESAIPIQGLPSALNVNVSLDTFTLTQYLGYRLFGRKRAAIHLLTGVRYYHTGSSINASIPSASVSYPASDNWVDYVEGARFQLQLTRRITAFVLGDVGGGGSVLSYNFVGGAGYDWSKKWSTSLAYRRLYYHRQTDSGLNIEPTQQGLVLGATYRFR
ncbi:MAG TPA: hypothetical protein VF753_09110 [Terriglobales bacterium]